MDPRLRGDDEVEGRDDRWKGGAGGVEDVGNGPIIGFA